MTDNGMNRLHAQRTNEREGVNGDPRDRE